MYAIYAYIGVVWGVNVGMWHTWSVWDINDPNLPGPSCRGALSGSR